MPQFTDAQLAGLVLGVGFSQQAAITAVAIAIRESSGNSDAVGDVSLETATWGPSIGLFQIRSLNSEKGKGTERDEIANKDPVTNAKHAYSISGGGVNWKPWSTYKGIAPTLPRAQLAVAHPDNTMPTGVGGFGGAAAGGTAQGGYTGIFASFINWLNEAFIRIGVGIVGIACIFFALKRMGVVSIPSASTVAGVASKVVIP
jgi:hypothetical protein